MQHNMQILRTFPVCMALFNSKPRIPDKFDAKNFSHSVLAATDSSFPEKLTYLSGPSHYHCSSSHQGCHPAP